MYTPPQVLAPRAADVSGLEIRRTLPHAHRRTIGPYCFLDHYGPHAVPVGDRGVPPHPHIGLQTVTWLFEGAMHHGDSLGSEQDIRPGQLNLMTAGRGITHWEVPQPEVAPRVHGVQFWVALPEARRHGEPAFEHHARVPVSGVGSWVIQTFLGEFLGDRSPATAHHPMLGVELNGYGGTKFPVDPTFEHGLLVDSGTVFLDDVPVPVGHLAAVDPGRDTLMLRADGFARVVLIGGAPFSERLLMWWNFVARTHEEIEAARTDWEAGRGFGDPASWPMARLPAPPISGRLHPR